MPSSESSAFVLSFDFDAEEVWIGENPQNAAKPGVLSQGTYGAKVGIELVLRLLADKGMQATFFVPGRVAERYPDRVREILEDGHEVAMHGYTHRSPADLSKEEEAEEFAMALAALRDLGVEPEGYRSPSWEFSEHTLSLLTEAGLSYSSNMMDDIRPYRYASCDIIELPVQWILDDAPHFWFDLASFHKKISTPSEVFDIWQEEFLGIRALGGLTVLTCHPQLIGRPSRLRMLDSFLDVVQGSGVHVATAREIAKLARSTCVAA
jgi:peptidoglycan/xylan/chitin deacetylase (PgdA/CDA1 family)